MSDSKNTVPYKKVTTILKSQKCNQEVGAQKCMVVVIQNSFIAPSVSFEFFPLTYSIWKLK